MITDDITIHVSGGKGGDGLVSFRREKFVPKGGPDGGNGGDGGNVYVRAVSNLTALNKYRNVNELQAEDGEKGKAKKARGRKGDHLYLNVPFGTTLTDTLTGDVWELTGKDQEWLVAKGGKGGRGNFEFRSNENKAPQFAEPGTPGQSRTINMSLAYIADIGLIGLPSAGKSSLLNALTQTDVKVGAYPFTTLEPNLGILGELVIADIPGLIEGAHKGKGLGIRFLKHIEKTKLLVHCLDATSSNLKQDYQTIRTELEKFNEDLLGKPEILVLTKSDLLTSPESNKVMKQASKLQPHVTVVSILNDEQLQELQKEIIKMC